MLRLFVPDPRLYRNYEIRFAAGRMRTRPFIVDPEMVYITTDGYPKSEPWINVNIEYDEEQGAYIVRPAYNGGGHTVIVLKLGLTENPKTYLVEHVLEPIEYVEGDIEFVYIYMVPMDSTNFPLARIRFLDGGDKIIFVRGISGKRVEYVLLDPSTAM